MASRVNSVMATPSLLVIGFPLASIATTRFVTLTNHSRYRSRKRHPDQFAGFPPDQNKTTAFLIRSASIRSGNTPPPISFASQAGRLAQQNGPHSEDCCPEKVNRLIPRPV